MNSTSATVAEIHPGLATAAETLNVDAAELKACIESGRPIKELLGLGDQIWEVMYDYGYRSYQNGQFAAAEYWWYNTCLFDCRRDRNWIALGMAYQRQQKYDLALNAYSLAVHHGGTNPWAPLHAAECHLQHQTFDKATGALNCAEGWADNVDEQDQIRKRIALLRRGIRKQQERLACASASSPGVSVN